MTDEYRWKIANLRLIRGRLMSCRNIAHRIGELSFESSLDGTIEEIETIIKRKEEII